MGIGRSRLTVFCFKKPVIAIEKRNFFWILRVKNCNAIMAKPNISLKVRLILYHKGSILLLKQTKPNGGNYTLVGGNIENMERARETLIRESFEEAGIILKEKDLQLVHVLQKIKKGQQRIILYFKAYRWEGKLKARETHKFKEVEWFELDSLPNNLTPTIQHVLEAYRKGLLFSTF